MATRNEVTTKKLKTGQRVTLDIHWKWAVSFSNGKNVLFATRNDARKVAKLWKHGYVSRIVRLNPITGVVSK